MPEVPGTCRSACPILDGVVTRRMQRDKVRLQAQVPGLPALLPGGQLSAAHTYPRDSQRTVRNHGLVPQQGAA